MVQIGDIIEYSYSEGKERYLGVMTGRDRLQPLCLRRPPEASLGPGEATIDAFDMNTTLELFQDEDDEEVSTRGVMIAGVVEDSFYSQRIVEDRISNPHGEHAEDVWLVRVHSLDDLRDGRQLVIRIR